jgi:hypothetical protein
LALSRRLRANHPSPVATDPQLVGDRIPARNAHADTAMAAGKASDRLVRTSDPNGHTQQQAGHLCQALRAAEQTGLKPDHFEQSLVRYLERALDASKLGYGAVFLTVVVIAALGSVAVARLVRKLPPPAASTERVTFRFPNRLQPAHTGPAGGWARQIKLSWSGLTRPGAGSRLLELLVKSLLTLVPPVAAGAEGAGR